MDMNAYLIVIFALCSIIPALIVAVVLFLRQETVRGDVNSAAQKVSLVFSEYQQITSQFKSVLDKIALVETSLHALSQRANSIDESFVALSNKWNSRERAERLAEKRRRKEEEDIPENEQPDQFNEIPGTKQQLLFPIDQSQNQTARQQRKRKFGEQP